jgi:tetratricopeptide (TPR) repeat protein
MNDSPESHIQKALELIESESFELALVELKLALKMDPESAHAWYCLGCVFNAMNDRKSAAKAFQQCTKFAPDRPQGWYNLGNCLKEMGTYDVAEKCFEVVVELAPEDADAWINLGFVLDEQGKHQSAINCYDRALPLAPDDVVAWANRGNSFAALGNGDEATKCYQKAIELDPNYELSYLAYGRLLTAQELFEQAVPVLTEATKRMPNEGWAWYFLAYALFKVDKKREAGVVIEKAVQMAEDHPDLWNNIGEVQFMLENYPEALAAYGQACDLQPGYYPARFGMARCFLLDGDKAKAREACEFYIAHANEDEPVLPAVRRMLELCE